MTIGMFLNGGVVAALLLLLRPQESSEYEVKAAFLYNFADPRYISWPDETGRDGAPFIIGVLGETPLYSVLEKLVKEKKIGGRRVLLRRLNDPAGAAGCRILFVSASELPHAADITRALADTAVLTVGDRPEFADQGITLAFAVVDRHVRFDVNAGAAPAGAPRPTAQLLRVARRIVGRGASK
jgi:hypothetical protein